MKFALNDFTIVVLANTNNPSILNPDFLKINQIINKEYKPVEVLCTPPISKISYEEKIIIVADIERLTFTDSDDDRIPHKSPIPLIANKYINVLKHVPYKAAGINFSGFYECSHISPDQFLLNKFISKGIWSDFKGIRPDIGLRFSYNDGSVIHNLNIDPAATTSKKEGRTFPSIAIRSNFHYAPAENTFDNIIKYLNTWELRYNLLTELLNKIFE